ncbi:hypothetical protein J6590_082760 [Homalodisca vitripennis]|nr:hypothetical protein J6590_082760 [Homalodisca vitripennis]
MWRSAVGKGPTSPTPNARPVGPPHGIKQITVGPPHGIKQITMFIRENVECLDSSFTTTTTIKSQRDRVSNSVQDYFPGSGTKAAQNYTKKTMTWFLFMSITDLGGYTSTFREGHNIICGKITPEVSIYHVTDYSNLRAISLTPYTIVSTLHQEAFKKLQLLTLPCLYILETTFFCMSKCALTRGRDIHMYETRGSAKYRTGRHRTVIYERLPSQATDCPIQLKMPQRLRR